MRIISESVLMLFAIVKINPFLSKLHLAKVGVFFETRCRFHTLCTAVSSSNIKTASKPQT